MNELIELSTNNMTQVDDYSLPPLDWILEVSLNPSMQGKHHGKMSTRKREP